MPDADGGGSAPDGSLLAADENEAQSSSPITQVSALSVASPDAQQRPSAPPPRRGFFAALLRCCGRMPDEGAEGAHRPPSRTLYIPPAPHTGPPFILPLQEGDKGKKTLVLDLDETLVHSSFKPVPNPDYIIPVEIDGKARGCPPRAQRSYALSRRRRCGNSAVARRAARDLGCRLCLTVAPARGAQITDVYVLKRPWVDQFMVRAGCLVFVSQRAGCSARRGSPQSACPDAAVHRRRWVRASR